VLYQDAGRAALVGDGSDAVLGTACTRLDHHAQGVQNSTSASAQRL
jgi:hypothetical protein